jgi:hypothetical protein
MQLAAAAACWLAGALSALRIYAALLLLLLLP